MSWIGRALCKAGFHAWVDDHFDGNPEAPVRECRRPDCLEIEFL